MQFMCHPVSLLLLAVQNRGQVGSLLMLWRIWELVLLLGAPLWLSYCYGTTNNTKLSRNNPIQQHFSGYIVYSSKSKTVKNGTFSYFSPASLHPLLWRCFQYVGRSWKYNVENGYKNIFSMWNQFQLHMNFYQISPPSLSNIECWVSPPAATWQCRHLPINFKICNFLKNWNFAKYLRETALPPFPAALQQPCK